MIVDAKGLVAGRIATKVAKALIKGEQVTVLNAQDAVVVGNTESIMEKYKRRVDAAIKSNPHFGPKYSRVPDRMFRRMVRNMLPTKKSAKERLIKNLEVFNTVPKELAKEKAMTFEEFKCNERYGYMSMKEIAEALGGRW
ncbi:MAG: 50S ribosomal protein L13 [archaeon]|jgi:large subunit ribosomal protein L13